jgi:hypothetical protein
MRVQSQEELYREFLPGMIKNELYAYFVSAKMLAFMAKRYPEIGTMLKKAYAKRADIERLMKETVICKNEDAGVQSILEALKGKQTEMALIAFAERLEAYTKAANTRKWRPFKDKVIADTLLHQFGLPYILPYLKSHGQEENFTALNKELEAIMNEDSPEKLFEK